MVESVIVPYLLLSNFNFNTAYFSQIIDNVLTTGASGIAGANVQTEQALVDAVFQTHLEAQRSTIDQAFRFVSQLNASTVSLADFSSGEDVLFPLDPIAGISPPVAGPAAGPSGLADAPPRIGRYELDLVGMTLDTFRQRYPDIRPRIRSGDQWIASTEPFAVEIHRNPDPSVIKTVEEILQQWQQSVSLSSISDNDTDGPASIPAAAATQNDNSMVLHSRDLIAMALAELQLPNANMVIVIVRYVNRPASLLIGYVSERLHEASVIYALTNPDNILMPYSRTAIRGSGQYALQQYIIHCIQRNMQLIRTNAITNVSALIKRRFGFLFEDD